MPPPSKTQATSQESVADAAVDPVPKPDPPVPGALSDTGSKNALPKDGPSSNKFTGKQPSDTVSNLPTNTNRIGMEFARIEPGAFIMGEGSKAYQVTLTKPYYLGVYACRAGTTTAYFFGDDESRLGEYAWFDKNSNGQTHPVGKNKPNAWGLYDMHGNVWEWCSDWCSEYLKEAVTDPVPLPKNNFPLRVNRGGSWRDYVEWCRSAERSAGSPMIRRDLRNGGRAPFVGFRLALSPSGIPQ